MRLVAFTFPEAHAEVCQLVAECLPGVAVEFVQIASAVSTWGNEHSFVLWPNEYKEWALRENPRLCVLERMDVLRYYGAAPQSDARLLARLRVSGEMLAGYDVQLWPTPYRTLPSYVDAECEPRDLLRRFEKLFDANDDEEMALPLNLLFGDDLDLVKRELRCLHFALRARDNRLQFLSALERELCVS